LNDVKASCEHLLVTNGRFQIFENGLLLANGLTAFRHGPIRLPIQFKPGSNMSYLNRVLVAAAIASLLVLSGAVFAHHSTSEFDQTVLVDIEGVVTEKFWRNPHVVFHVLTEQGEDWLIEGSSVSSQNRRGISSDVINVGDNITVAGHVSTRQPNDMVMRHILLANGLELTLGGNSEPYWPEVQQLALSSTGPSAEQIAESEATADGLFRVWSWGRLEPGWWFFAGPDAFPLTDAALEKFASWNEYTENPQLECISPGMPLTMGNPYPIEFVQQDENIILLHAHEFDVTRVIHLNAEPDLSADESIMGYSVGHWEDENTLVVDTANINYPYFNRVGISSGPDLTVHERFILDDEAGSLQYFTTITDPWALTEPYTKELLWIWQPGTQLGTYGCQLSEDYAP
jgi:hypothetical protein